MTERRSGSDWVIDVAAFLFALGVGVAVLATTHDEHSELGTAIDVLLGVIALGLLWVRRRHPAMVALLVCSASAVSGLAAGPAVVAIFGATVRCPRRTLLLLWPVAVVAGFVYPLIYPSDSSYLVELALGTLFMGVVLGWGLYARARHQLLVSLRERAARLEAEQAQRVAQARAAQRREIAREMHDVLAHRLSLLSLHAGALEYRADASPDEVRDAAAVIRDSAHAALEELRAVIGVLRDPDDPGANEPPQPTIDALGRLIDESRAAGTRVALSVELAGQVPPVTLGRTAYRIVQEGVTNARKHAPGAAVDVEVRAVPGPALDVTIRSRAPVGAPTAPPPGAGTGLVGLAERVSLAGGALDHGRDDDGDFVLHATLPWTP